MNSGNLTKENRLLLHFGKPGGDEDFKANSLVGPRTVSIVNILMSCMSNFVLVDFPTFFIDCGALSGIVVSTCPHILFSNSRWMGILMESHNRNLKPLTLVRLTFLSHYQSVHEF